MKYNKTLALIPAMLLAACGGDDQSINEPVTPGSVVYSYPADGQSEVSPKADLVLRFSHALSDEDIEGKVRIRDGENDIAFSTEAVDEGRSLRILLDERLSPATEYTIDFSEELEADGGRIIATPNAIGPEGIQFTTRGEFSGIAALDNLGDGFAVAEMIPSESNTFRPMNFSTFRLRLTKPAHPEWKERGGIIELTDSNGETVPATVLVNGRYITIDPCIADSPELCGREGDVLNSGENYTVSIRNLPGINGDTLAEFSEEITPRDTGPTVVLFQEVIDSGLNAGEDESSARRSRLNGQIINGVTLNSVLQGIAGPSQQTGGLFAELAYAPAFEADEPLPLRVPKGSVLNSSSLDVRINGTVPVIDPGTGMIQQTGNIKVTMLSDATGYLMPNPYTDDMSAPRHVKLFMDVSMNTEEAQPNASLSQDLLGVELTGIAIVEDGVLTIDAIGMVEPNLLGQEFTDSTIAFRIEAATDSKSALDAADQRDNEFADNTGPQLVSWMPGPVDAVPSTRQDMQRPGDPVVLNFDEPLDAETIADGIALYEGNTRLRTSDGKLKAKLDGTALVLNPEGGLKHGVNYTVQIGNALTDLAGNGITPQDLTFTLPDLGDSVTQSSPLALTTYPGYPCVTTGVNLSQGTHGQCNDAAEGGPAGDVLPVTELPEDRPIVVVFSQSMNLSTINDGTFIVEKVTDSSTPIGSGEIVSGRIEKNNQRIRFYPENPWDTADGSFYRYTMRSASGAGNCSNAICSVQNYPLQTDMLTNSTDAGGPDMTIYFKGSEAQETVFTPLRNLPIRDVNSNYVVDCPTLGGKNCLEPFNHDGSEAEGFLPSANAAKLLVDGQTADGGVLGDLNARVGCSSDGPDCPHNKFIYQTYALNTEVTGPATDPETGQEGVGVLLYPTMLATTSTDVYIDLPFLLGGEQTSTTGPQILRMRYAKDDPDCTSNCARNSLIPGIIVEGVDGPVFKTEAELFLDAPDLVAPLGATHNLYSYPFTLKLEGPVKFFDDGRMQVEQRTLNVPQINVEAVALGIATVKIPLFIPQQGVYLNFISNPIKEIPAEY
ncbi:Ig-like domain-containing protein [Marinobacter sp. TBZ242]|uniref:Ig-like domain-containing protein n=1 Tax=Marinobacter azerbaijanicus TaxID=3050455 RepID=A0ABT7IFK1_9GAMM|nr:Ig-like domain-containing protein [Marinobacter sp. TBZ242]MDL0432448.1 Ig-like domain-containing protein [Marinobacter sp. TBZ242]